MTTLEMAEATAMPGVVMDRPLARGVRAPALGPDRRVLDLVAPVQGPILPAPVFVSDVQANPRWDDLAVRPPAGERSAETMRLVSMRHTQGPGVVAGAVTVHRVVVTATDTPAGVVTGRSTVEVIVEPMPVCVRCGEQRHRERMAFVCPVCLSPAGQCTPECSSQGAYEAAWACYRCVPALDPFWAGVASHRHQFRRTLHDGTVYETPWMDTSGRPERNVFDRLACLPNPDARSSWSLALSNPGLRGWSRVINGGDHIVASVWSERRGQWAVVTGYYVGHSYPKGTDGHKGPRDTGLPVQAWQRHPLPVYVAEAYCWVGSAAADMEHHDMARAELVDDVPDAEGIPVPDPTGAWDCLSRSWVDSQGRRRKTFIGWTQLFADEAEDLAKWIAGDWAEQVQVDEDEPAEWVEDWSDYVEATDHAERGDTLRTARQATREARAAEIAERTAEWRRMQAAKAKAQGPGEPGRG